MTITIITVIVIDNNKKMGKGGNVCNLVSIRSYEV